MWALMMVVWLSLVCCSLEEIKISFDEMEDDPRRRLKSSPLHKFLYFSLFCVQTSQRQICRVMCGI